MEINIRLYTTLRKYGPPNLMISESFKVNLKEGFTVIQLLEKIKIQKDIDCVIMVNGEIQPDFGYNLKNNDFISIFPSVGGGNYTLD